MPDKLKGILIDIAKVAVTAALVGVVKHLTESGLKEEEPKQIEDGE